MKKLTVVEIYPWLAQIHLYKDPGAVLHELVKEGAYGEILVTPKKLDTESFLPKIVWVKKPFFWRTLVWLWKHAKRFDVLFMFHTHPLNLIYGPLYKLRNPRGVSYIKADMDTTILNLNKLTLLNIIRRAKLWLNLLHVDVFSVEQERVLTLLQKNYPRHSKKMIHVPNGHLSDNEVSRNPFSKKENIILTVGPVGSTQKGTDTIFKVLERIGDLGNWKVVMAGAVFKDFRHEIAAFFARNPGMKGKVEILGHVAERKQMLQLYNSAKIFFMPSRYETFSLAALEAAYFGNVIVGTPVGGIPELTQEGKHGAVCEFGDTQGLVRELKKRMRDQKLLTKESRLTRERCEQHFLWEKFIPKLYKRLSR